MAAVSGGREKEQKTAVLIIEKWWISIRDRKIFKVLKATICSAEHSLTHEILRKLSPRECLLLKDPSMKTKVKFRLNGTRFPPTVVFKIYSKAHSVQYISGRNMFHPKTEAAEDARQQMGNRTYYDQLLFDSTRHHKYAITDLHDIGTVKDYMKYSANLDETPALYGGRENYWRELDLNELPRHCITGSFINIYQSPAYNRPNTLPLPHSVLSSILRTSTNTTTPLHGINTNTDGCMMERSESASPAPGSGTLKHNSREKNYGRERGSKLAVKRVQKMRRSFTADSSSQSREGDTSISLDNTGDLGLSPIPDGMSISPDHGMGISPDGMGFSPGVPDDGNESEILQLYKWTQDLSLEDLN